MTDWINSLLPALQNLGMLNYWLVLLVSFLESFAIVGSFVPGTLFLMTVGFIASQGYPDIGDLIIFTALGAFLADCASYFLGTKGTRFFHNENKLLKLNHLDAGKRFFAIHGTKSIILGRFIGPIRAVVPFVAGLSKMNFKIFLLWDLFGAFLASSAYLFAGYFFGDAIKNIQRWCNNVGWIIFFLALLLLFSFFLIKRMRLYYVSKD